MLRSKLTANNYDFLTTLFKGSKTDDGGLFYVLGSSDDPSVKFHKSGAATVWVDHFDVHEFENWNAAVSFLNK